MNEIMGKRDLIIALCQVGFDALVSLQYFFTAVQYFNTYF